MPALPRFAALSEVQAMQWSQLIRQGGMVLAAILLAQSGLSQAEIGRYELLQYLGALLSAAWVGGFIQGLLATHARLADPPRQRGLWLVAAGAFTGFALLTALIVAFGPPFLLRALSGQGHPAYRHWFALLLLGQLPALLHEYFYLLQGRARAIFFYSSLNSFAVLACTVLPPWLGLRFEFSFQALAAWSLLRFVWLWAFVLYHAAPLRSQWPHLPAAWRAWLTPSLPLAAYALLALLNQSIDFWWVGRLFPGQETTFALYRYGARELPIAPALAAALASALLPRLTADLHAALPELRRQAARLCHLFYPPAILLAVASPWWFTALFTEAFAQSRPIFNLFILIGAGRMVFSLTIAIALGENRAALRAAGWSIAAHLILSGLLALPLGLTGIALGALLAYLLEKAYLVLLLHRKYGIRPSQYIPLRLWLGYTLALAIAALWSAA